MNQGNDFLYRRGKFNNSFDKVDVKKETDKFITLENGVKLDKETLSFVPKTKAAKHRYKYYTPTDEMNREFEEQKMSRSERFMSWVSSFDAEEFFSSNSLALVFSAALLVAQVFHTSHALFELSSSLGWAKYPFGIFSAIFLDALILFFLSNGSKIPSFIAMLSCFLLNVYSYHIGYEWWSYNSYFSLIPSIFVPYSIHAVGTVILKKKN